MLRYRIVHTLICALAVGCSEPRVDSTDPVLQAFEGRLYGISISRQGEDGLRFDAVPKKPWEVSADFPTALRVRAAASRSEVDARITSSGPEGVHFEFAVPSATEGPARLSGSLSFAVCDGDLCERIDHEWSVEVGDESAR